jgi:uncharacterized protein involved in exopolysaccharide biosynthesis
MSEEEEYDADQSRGGGSQLELVKSYLHFVQRAVKKRLWMSIVIVICGLTLTILTFKYFPRTFVCTTVMMGDGNQVFQDWQPAPFGGANNLILRRANLEALVRDTGLARTYRARRPPILKLKDDIVQQLFGQWNEALIASFLVPTLESRLNVTVDGSTMTVSVAWNDPQTAQELAEAARDSFLKVRQDSNTEAFREKMAILDGHASKLREEVEQLAEQIDKMTKVKAKDPEAATGSPARRSLARLTARRSDASDAGSAEDKLKLEEMKRKLAELENDRERRLREERSKLDDLKLRLSPSHPSVITAEQRIGLLQQVPSETALLRAEVKDLEGMMTQREAMAKQAALSGRGGAVGSEPLPAAITAMLDEDDADPALVAQLSGAIGRYGSLRDQLRAVRIDLDTAQAAFNQRYKILVPAEVPNRPVKPNPVAILGGGFIAALFIALLLPILLELRTGIIVERWQVQMVQLPVLAEIRLPPRAGE